MNWQVQRSLSQSPYTTRLHWSWCSTGTAHRARSDYPPFVQKISTKTIAVLFALLLQDHCALCRTVRTKTKTVEQNWTNRLYCFCHRYQWFFHLFYTVASPFPKLMFVLRNPRCICQRCSPSGAFLPVGSASLKRSLALNYWERPQPLLCQGDGLVNQWQNETHTQLSCCSHTTSHLWAGHTYTSADEPDTWPLLYAQTHVWAGPRTGQIRTRWLQYLSALILHTKQLAKCFVKGIVQAK